MHTTPQSSPSRGSDFRFPILPLEQTADLPRVDPPSATSDYDSTSDAGRDEDTYHYISRPQSVVSDEETLSAHNYTASESEPEDYSDEPDEPDELRSAPSPEQVSDSDSWDHGDLDNSGLTIGTIIPSDEEHDASNLGDNTAQSSILFDPLAPSIPAMSALGSENALLQQLPPNIQDLPRLQLKRPFRVAFHGPPEKKSAVLDKIAQALATPARASTSADHMATVPVSSSSSSTDEEDDTQVTVVPPPGLELEVDDCALCNAKDSSKCSPKACREAYALCPMRTGTPLERTKNRQLCQDMCHHDAFCAEHKNMYTWFAKKPDLVVILHDLSHTAEASGCAEPCSMRFANSLKGPALLNIFDRPYGSADEIFSLKQENAHSAECYLAEKRLSVSLVDYFSITDDLLGVAIAHITGRHQKVTTLKTVRENTAKLWTSFVREVKMDKFGLVSLFGIFIVVAVLPFLVYWANTLRVPAGLVSVQSNTTQVKVQSHAVEFPPLQASNVRSKAVSSVASEVKEESSNSLAPYFGDGTLWKPSWAQVWDREPAAAPTAPRIEDAQAPRSPAESFAKAQAAVQTWLAHSAYDLLDTMRMLRTLAAQLADQIVEAMVNQSKAARKHAGPLKRKLEHLRVKLGGKVYENIKVGASALRDDGADGLKKFNRALFRKARLGAYRLTGGRIGSRSGKASKMPRYRKGR